MTSTGHVFHVISLTSAEMEALRARDKHIQTVCLSSIAGRHLVIGLIGVSKEALALVIGACLKDPKGRIIEVS